MRLLLRAVLVGIVLAAGVLPICLQAQAIRGPVFGYVPDVAGTAVRPLLGIPGASSLGERLPLNVGVRRIQVSPKQDYLLAVRNEDRTVVLFDLAAEALSARPVAFSGAADLLSISPSGSAAATYDAAARLVRTIAGLPGNPGQVRTFDASPLLGRAASLAVSDDGSLAFVRSEVSDSGQSRSELTVIGDQGLLWRVPSEDAAVAFVPGRRDIVVADNLSRSVFLVTDIGGSYARVPLFTLTEDAGTLANTIMSADGLRVFVSTQSGMVAIVEVPTGQATWLSCQCRPTTLESLKGPSLFRLTEASDTEPIIVLDASPADTRFVMTPPNTVQ